MVGRGGRERGKVNYEKGMTFIAPNRAWDSVKWWSAVQDPHTEFRVLVQNAVTGLWESKRLVCSHGPSRLLRNQNPLWMRELRWAFMGAHRPCQPHLCDPISSPLG